MLEVRLHGVRGSVPVSEHSTERYGGNTTCIEVSAGDSSHHVLIDAGTGIRRLGHILSPGGIEFHILFSHFHWDHIEGLAFFTPIFQPGQRFTFYGRPEGMSVQDALEGAMRPPWFPIALADTPSLKRYVDLEEEPFEVGGLTVESISLNHPQGVRGYRLDSDGRVVVIATDHEAGVGEVDQRLIRWAQGADLLLHDGQYTADDYDAHRGWGHSTWDRAVDTALAAEVKRLVVISHDPAREDDEIDELQGRARRRFPPTSAGHAGMVITL